MSGNTNIPDTSSSSLEGILRSLRVIIKNSDENFQSGGLAFYDLNTSIHNGLNVKTFPIVNNPNNQIPNEFLEGFLKEINALRDYNDFYHFNYFKEKHASIQHYLVDIPDNKVIKQIDKTKGINTNSDTWIPWDKILSETEKEGGLIEKNQLDQLLLPEGTSNLTVIPIPFVTSPAVLVILPRDIQHGFMPIVKKLFADSRTVVNHYISGRLLTRLKENISDFEEEKELIDTFLHELAHVLLPIRYRLNDGDWFDGVSDWPSDNSYTFNVNFGSGKFEMKFCLPNFKVMDDQWMSEYPSKQIFELNQLQLSDRIGQLFELLHTNWVHEKNKIRLLDEALSSHFNKVLNETGININNIQKSIDEMNQVSKKLTNFVTAIETIKSVSISDLLSKFGEQNESRISLLWTDERSEIRTSIYLDGFKDFLQEKSIVGTKGIGGGAAGMLVLASLISLSEYGKKDVTIDFNEDHWLSEFSNLFMGELSYLPIHPMDGINSTSSTNSQNIKEIWESHDSEIIQEAIASMNSLKEFSDHDIDIVQLTQCYLKPTTENLKDLIQKCLAFSEEEKVKFLEMLKNKLPKVVIKEIYSMIAAQFDANEITEEYIQRLGSVYNCCIKMQKTKVLLDSIFMKRHSDVSIYTLVISTYNLSKKILPEEKFSATSNSLYKEIVEKLKNVDDGNSDRKISIQKKVKSGIDVLVKSLSEFGGFGDLVINHLLESKTIELPSNKDQVYRVPLPLRYIPRNISPKHRIEWIKQNDN